MKKLKLNLDDLKVESFEISGNAGQGTVFGQLPVETDALAGCTTGGGTGGGGTDWSNCVCLSVTCPPTLACQSLICNFTDSCPPYSQLTNCTHNQLC